MKFIIDYTGDMAEGIVEYLKEAYSYDTKPGVHAIDFDLILNKLTLTVVDEKIVQVWGYGYSGDVSHKTFKLSPPISMKGSLIVSGDFEYGFSHRINKDTYPVYINNSTGWSCIGYPDIKGSAVEFLTNCIAVVVAGELASLWIKPIIVD